MNTIILPFGNKTGGSNFRGRVINPPLTVPKAHLVGFYVN